MAEEIKVGQVHRKISQIQKQVSFPARPEEIDREMLSPLDPSATDDSDPDT
jgi:hypothetical protein